ncbi:oxidoreductase [Lithospermum erythrorhizon]|uniref:Oxidoreductase n=1 Tax=Lithospermum erythrorhizon TaxID=34254 RepID=A0AAV3NSB5_LITER
MNPIINVPNSNNQEHDHNHRLQQLKKFDESKVGVKGLVDRGITSIPSIFVHTTRPDPPSRPGPNKKVSIPVIDLSSPRKNIVDEVRKASSELGFFQIINHGIEVESVKEIVESIKMFFEQPEEEKMKYYRREPTNGIAYSTNFDLYNSKAASWRDTLQARLSPEKPDWENVPKVCRGYLVEWDEKVESIGAEMLEILCEGLGVEKNRLKDMSCMGARTMAAHYYPYCPQPDLTAGLTSHTDPGLLTVLVQNLVPGLQVKVGEEWVDVEPLEGGIVFNIGDILQILSNDTYKSVEHRVLANPFPEPRVSAAVFLNPSKRDDYYGPLPELLSVETPARYRQFLLPEYLKRFFTKELDGKTLTNYYRV